MGSGQPGGKELENLTIFSLKIEWYSLLKTLKLKLSLMKNYYYDISYL